MSTNLSGWRDLVKSGFLSWILIFAFLFNTLGPLPLAQAELASSLGSDTGWADAEFHLPAPGVMVRLSPPLNPPILKGIKVHPDNPFRFDFILDQGDSLPPVGSQQAAKLVKYFLASLTIPEKDLWVNLSPYEKDRVIPQSFGLTEMGRDLLAEDYMLKQITASLIYPEDAIGKKFWKRIYEEAARKFSKTDIPVNTFNKVWIVPEKAVVYENEKAGTAYVVESRLKVMLEQDYLALEKNTVQNDVNTLGSQIVREIVIPELTKEVNEDKNFAQLRQVYNSLILATWYKKKIKDSILAQVYEDRKKVVGVGYGQSIIPNTKSVILPAPPLRDLRRGLGSAAKGLKTPLDSSPSAQNDTELIYQRYLQAFKRGVYNYIKEEQDSATQKVIPRKYFSGGTNLNLDGLLEQSRFLPENVSSSKAMIVEADLAQISPPMETAPGRPEAGQLDGLTILRFSHSMELIGGVQMYLSELDRLLLQRNKATIIQVFYTKDQTLENTEIQIGEGRLIQIPVLYNPEATSVVANVEGLIKAHLVDFVKRNGLDVKGRKKYIILPVVKRRPCVLLSRVRSNQVKYCLKMFWLIL